MYLLNTDILLDLLEPKPTKSVLSWFAAVPPEQVFISVLCLGALREEMDKLVSVQHKSLLLCWVKSNFVRWIKHNVIPVDLKIAERWGDLRLPEGKDSIEALVIATAVEKGLVLVTAAQVQGAEGLKIFNPFV